MEDISSNLNINNIISGNDKKSEEKFIPRLGAKKININDMNIKKLDNIEGKNNEMKEPLFSKEKSENFIDSRKTVYDLKQNRNSILDENIPIRRIYKEFNGRNSLIKRTYSMPDIEHENIFEAETKVCCPTLNMNDFMLNYNEELNNRESPCILDNLPDIDEDFNDRYSMLNINDNIIQNISDKVEDKKERKIDEIKIPRITRSKSLKIEKEITSDYNEENEHKNKNIIFYKNTINKIKCLSFNLLLKKIIFEDFLRKHASEIYHFCQQCFCFVNADIFFGKILNCYKYYRKKNVSYEKLANLIEFFNILIIEMFGYYKIIPKNNIQSIKLFYNEVISDLIINNNINSNSFIGMNYNRDEFINYNLNFNENITEENEEKFNDEISNKYSMDESLSNVIEEKDNNDNDYIVIEKDEDTYDENIYNEEKELINYINILFLNDSFSITRNSLYIKSETISILTVNEEILLNLKLFLNLFKSKRPNDGQISEAKNSIVLYKILKEANKFHKTKINHLKKSFINRSHCLTLNEKVHSDKNINKRTYLLNGFFSLYDWKPEEIGEELIRVTKKLLNKIEKRELYKAVYLKKNKNITSPNVLENINHFNKLTCFIIEDIISYDNPSDRAKIIEKWAQVADYCKSKRDFNDCIAIYSALNNYIITGLNLTNKELSYKGINLIKSISTFCSCDGNYRNIREEIKKFVNLQEYYYPYLGMMLRDITFFEENSKYLVNDNLINFEKIEDIQNIIENNFRYQEEDQKNEQKYIYIKELSFFENLENNTEENLESIANKIEPKFELNDGKKVFKRKTIIDEKYFVPLKTNSLFRKSFISVNGLFPFS